VAGCFNGFFKIQTKVVFLQRLGGASKIQTKVDFLQRLGGASDGGTCHVLARFFLVAPT
jgi:hypothetical protein